MTPDKVEDWKKKVQDWWYSIQDLLAEKDICLHERKRVEIETIIKDTLTQYHQDMPREVTEHLRDAFKNQSEIGVNHLNVELDELERRYLPNPGTK